jgi:hypothetical protein
MNAHPKQARQVSHDFAIGYYRLFKGLFITHCDPVFMLGSRPTEAGSLAHARMPICSR